MPNQRLPILLAALTMFLAAPARAGIYIWDGGANDGKWSSSQNWRLVDAGVDPPAGDYPGRSDCDDEAIIPSGFKVKVDVDICLDTIIIGADSKVTIQENRAVLNASFEGQGSLMNRGRVVCDLDGHTVSLGPDLIVSDTTDARWIACGNGATLSFHGKQNSVLELKGRIHVSKGSGNNAIIRVFDILVVTPQPLNDLTHDAACGANVVCEGDFAFFVWNTDDEAQGCPYIP